MTEDLGQSKGNKGKQYASLNLSTYKGRSNLESQHAKIIPNKHGLQSLGKVPSSRRMPPPANLPSLKSETGGHDINASPVPPGAPGWRQNKDLDHGGSGPDASATRQAGGAQYPGGGGARVEPRPQYHPPGSMAPAAGSRSWAGATAGLKHRDGVGEYTSASHFNQEFPTLKVGDIPVDHERSDSQPREELSLRPQKEGRWRGGGGSKVPQSQTPTSPLDRDSFTDRDGYPDGGQQATQPGPMVPQSYTDAPHHQGYTGRQSVAVHPYMYPPPPYPTYAPEPPPPHPGAYMRPPYHSYPIRYPPGPAGPAMYPHPHQGPIPQHQRPTVIKQSALNEMDELERDNDAGWADSTHHKVNYDEQLNFDDDDEPDTPTSTGRDREGESSPRDAFIREQQYPNYSANRKYTPPQPGWHEPRPTTKVFRQDLQSSRNYRDFQPNHNHYMVRDNDGQGNAIDPNMWVVPGGHPHPPPMYSSNIQQTHGPMPPGRMGGQPYPPFNYVQSQGHRKGYSHPQAMYPNPQPMYRQSQPPSQPLYEEDGWQPPVEQQRSHSNLSNHTDLYSEESHQEGGSRSASRKVSVPPRFQKHHHNDGDKHGDGEYLGSHSSDSDYLGRNPPQLLRRDPRSQSADSVPDKGSQTPDSMYSDPVHHSSEYHQPIQQSSKGAQKEDKSRPTDQRSRREELMTSDDSNKRHDLRYSSRYEARNTHIDDIDNLSEKFNKKATLSQVKNSKGIKRSEPHATEDLLNITPDSETSPKDIKSRNRDHPRPRRQIKSGMKLVAKTLTEDSDDGMPEAQFKKTDKEVNDKSVSHIAEENNVKGLSDPSIAPADHKRVIDDVAKKLEPGDESDAKEKHPVRRKELSRRVYDASTAPHRLENDRAREGSGRGWVFGREYHRGRGGRYTTAANHGISRQHPPHYKANRSNVEYGRRGGRQATSESSSRNSDPDVTRQAPKVNQLNDDLKTSPWLGKSMRDKSSKNILQDEAATPDDKSKINDIGNVTNKDSNELPCDDHDQGVENQSNAVDASASTDPIDSWEESVHLYEESMKLETGDLKETPKANSQSGTALQPQTKSRSSNIWKEREQQMKSKRDTKPADAESGAPDVSSGDGKPNRRDGHRDSREQGRGTQRRDGGRYPPSHWGWEGPPMRGPRRGGPRRGPPPPPHWMEMDNMRKGRSRGMPPRGPWIYDEMLDDGRMYHDYPPPPPRMDRRFNRFQEEPRRGPRGVGEPRRGPRSGGKERPPRSERSGLGHHSSPSKRSGNRLSSKLSQSGAAKPPETISSRQDDEWETASEGASPDRNADKPRQSDGPAPRNVKSAKKSFSSQRNKRYGYEGNFSPSHQKDEQKNGMGGRQIPSALANIPVPGERALQKHSTTTIATGSSPVVPYREQESQDNDGCQAGDHDSKQSVPMKQAREYQEYVQYAMQNMAGVVTIDSLPDMSIAEYDTMVLNGGFQEVTSKKTRAQRRAQTDAIDKSSKSPGNSKECAPGPEKRSRTSRSTGDTEALANRSKKSKKIKGGKQQRKPELPPRLAAALKTVVFTSGDIGNIAIGSNNHTASEFDSSGMGHSGVIGDSREKPLGNPTQEQLKNAWIKPLPLQPLVGPAGLITTPNPAKDQLLTGVDGQTIDPVLGPLPSHPHTCDATSVANDRVAIVSTTTTGILATTVQNDIVRVTVTEMMYIGSSVVSLPSAESRGNPLPMPRTPAQQQSLMPNQSTFQSFSNNNYIELITTTMANDEHSVTLSSTQDISSTSESLYISPQYNNMTKTVSSSSELQDVAISESNCDVSYSSIAFEQDSSSCDLEASATNAIPSLTFESSSAAVQGILEATDEPEAVKPDPVLVGVSSVVAPPITMKPQNTPPSDLGLNIMSGHKAWQYDAAPLSDTTHSLSTEHSPKQQQNAIEPSPHHYQSTIKQGPVSIESSFHSSLTPATSTFNIVRTQSPSAFETAHVTPIANDSISTIFDSQSENPLGNINNQNYSGSSIQMSATNYGSTSQSIFPSPSPELFQVSDAQKRREQSQSYESGSIDTTQKLMYQHMSTPPKSSTFDSLVPQLNLLSGQPLQQQNRGTTMFNHGGTNRFNQMSSISGLPLSFTGSFDIPGSETSAKSSLFSGQAAAIYGGAAFLPTVSLPSGNAYQLPQAVPPTVTSASYFSGSNTAAQLGSFNLLGNQQYNFGMAGVLPDFNKSFPYGNSTSDLNHANISGQSTRLTAQQTNYLSGTAAFGLSPHYRTAQDVASSLILQNHQIQQQKVQDIHQQQQQTAFLYNSSLFTPQDASTFGHTHSLANQSHDLYNQTFTSPPPPFGGAAVTQIQKPQQFTAPSFGYSQSGGTGPVSGKPNQTFGSTPNAAGHMAFLQYDPSRFSHLGNPSFSSINSSQLIPGLVAPAVSAVHQPYLQQPNVSVGAISSYLNVNLVQAGLPFNQSATGDFNQALSLQAASNLAPSGGHANKPFGITSGLSNQQVKDKPVLWGSSDFQMKQSPSYNPNYKPNYSSSVDSTAYLNKSPISVATLPPTGNSSSFYSPNTFNAGGFSVNKSGFYGNHPVSKTTLPHYNEAWSASSVSVKQTLDGADPSRSGSDMGSRIQAAPHKPTGGGDKQKSKPFAPYPAVSAGGSTLKGPHGYTQYLQSIAPTRGANSSSVSASEFQKSVTTTTGAALNTSSSWSASPGYTARPQSMTSASRPAGGPPSKKSTSGSSKSTGYKVRTPTHLRSSYANKNPASTASESSPSTKPPIPPAASSAAVTASSVATSDVSRSTLSANVEPFRPAIHKRLPGSYPYSETSASPSNNAELVDKQASGLNPEAKDFPSSSTDKFPLTAVDEAYPGNQLKAGELLDIKGYVVAAESKVFDPLDATSVNKSTSEGAAVLLTDVEKTGSKVANLTITDWSLDWAEETDTNQDKSTE